MNNKMWTAALLISNCSVKQWNKKVKVRSISFLKCSTFFEYFPNAFH